MITQAQALTLCHRAEIIHTSLKYADGKNFLRARVNGACKTWKTRPDDFSIPMKYGFRECFYLTPANAGCWRLPDAGGK